MQGVGCREESVGCEEGKGVGFTSWGIRLPASPCSAGFARMSNLGWRLVGMVAPRLYIACAPRWITRRILRLRVVPVGTVRNFRTTASQKCESVPNLRLIESCVTRF